MKHEMELFVLAALAVLIVLFVALYQRRFAGRPKAGLHLQTLGLSLAWVGGALAFALDRVELGAQMIIIGIVIGVLGLVVQTRRRKNDLK